MLLPLLQNRFIWLFVIVTTLISCSSGEKRINIIGSFPNQKKVTLLFFPINDYFSSRTFDADIVSDTIKFNLPKKEWGATLWFQINFENAIDENTYISQLCVDNRIVANAKILAASLAGHNAKTSVSIHD